MWHRTTSLNIFARVFVTLLLASMVAAQKTSTSPPEDDSNIHPPVTNADLQIAKRAREILNSPAVWNRADNRQCPAGARTFSLYCALEVATTEVSGKAEHRGAALQEARFVIDEIAANRNYEHRLMNYNNDPATAFADIQEVLRMVESLLTLRLKTDSAVPPAVKSNGPPPGNGNNSAVTKADLEIIKRTRQILNSPSKWNRDATQQCPADAITFNLFCAFVKAATEVNGTFDEHGAALREARRLIDETPNHQSYKARLVDYNRDPAITFADIQKLLQLVEEGLTRTLAQSASK